MKISEMKKILKEMKEICKYRDDRTQIVVRSSSIDPFVYDERVRLDTNINGINIILDKIIPKK